MESKIVGYSFWGFLGDEKFDNNGNKLSTPDGNAFYSWSIIYELMSRGYDVLRLMPDRDKPGFNRLRSRLFDSWCTSKRYNAYVKSYRLKYGDNYSELTKDFLFDLWDEAGLSDFDFILHEWRMKIPGRNDIESKGKEGWQPDLFIQDALLEYTREHGIPIIIFDLDYKLEPENDIIHHYNVHIFELGNKLSSMYPKCSKVYIPFDFSSIDEFGVKDLYGLPQVNNLVYVGNRYERDWCIDKYIPTEMNDVIVYGNWKESGRDSEQRWPNIKFGNRLQTFEMKGVYSNSVATILLAKKDYCDNQFMTARIIESIFYGTVPLFIEEYGEECIKEYAGVYANFLTVKSKGDVIEKVYRLKYDLSLRSAIIHYLRCKLSFMDVKNFVNKCIEVTYRNVFK